MKIKPFNAKFAQLTRILSDGQYHDGNILGQTLNITRSAIWKMIKKLEEYGIEVNSIQSNGYSLEEPLLLLEPELIKKAFSGNIDVTVLESISSTNDYFKLQNTIQPLQLGCCFAEHQLHGRGRMNRVWSSPFGKNIHLSVYYLFQKDLAELAGLSLVMSLVVLDTLSELGLKEGIAKWPNDVLYQGKKIAGILIEVQAESHGFCKVTMGIGLNVNTTSDDPLDISQAWTSLREESGMIWDRNEVAIILLRYLHSYIHRFEQHGFSAFSEAWDAVNGLKQKVVTLEYGEQRISGTVVGINPNGNLLLRLADGNVQAFSSGDVTLLKQNANKPIVENLA